MNIYLATRYSRNAEMGIIRDELTQWGHHITSRWIDLHEGSVEVVSKKALAILEKSFTPEQLNTTPHLCAEYAIADIDDLIESDCVISFTCGTGGKGGRHVELGIALALHKWPLVVGPRENIFHTLPQVDWYPDWESAKSQFYNMY